MNGEAAVSDGMASTLSTCIVRRFWAEQDEGPYHRGAQPLRRDVVEDREGVALRLGIRLGRGRAERPLDATVEIWQCDALGRYSGFPPADSPEPATAEVARRAAYLPDQTFLRGRQMTDPGGMVEFETIYPGWYPGRAVHIHLMVHASDAVWTTQLYFPDTISNDVFKRAPYSQRSGRDTTNATDEIFPTGGDPAVLDVSPDGDASQAAICLVVPEDAPAR